jgi:hypothetical protein
MDGLRFQTVTAHEGLEVLGFDLTKPATGRIALRLGMVKVKHYAFRFRLRDRKILTRWTVDQAHVCRDAATGEVISVVFDKKPDTSVLDRHWEAMCAADPTLAAMDAEWEGGR